MKLTKQQAIEGHRKMWNWIADEIEKRQKVLNVVSLEADYCENNNLCLKGYCFCCEYNKDIYNCTQCPLTWGEPNTCCNSIETGLYDMLLDALTWQEQAEFARQIANLPERKLEGEE